MGKKLGILTLHGMGKQKVDYFKKLTERIANELGAQLWSKVQVEAVYYHGEMQENQELMWERMNVGKDLDAAFFRKKMLHSFSDAVNIQNYSSTSSMGCYATNCVRESVNTLASALESNNTPIIAIAQSLGNQVLSNYMWDAEKGKGIFLNSPASEQERLQQLRVWFSTGNNMPLFVSGLAENDIEPISKPNDDFEWLNFYDRDDALGWPLAPVSQKYRELLCVEDIEIQTGFNMLTAHPGYWTDDNFTNPLCDKIKNLLE